MTFTLEMEPPTATAQEKQYTVRNGRVMVYEKTNARIAKQKLRMALMPYRPDEPIEGPISLSVCWVFTWPKSTPKCRRTSYKISKPDTDNLNKGLKDILTKLGFWHDDAQVCIETITKSYAEKPGIYITIEKMEENNG